MSQQQDTVLIVDDDPAARTLLREQVFSPQTYRVFEAKDAPEALLMLRQNRPDLIVLDLVLPGLSGHDLLVAVQSQGYRGPLIAVAERTNASPRAVVEAFRLGATDFVTKPLREAEVLTAVERGLADVRLRRQRDSLVTQLQTANQQLEAHVKELTTLYEIGQSVTALADLDSVFNRVLEGAVTLTGADHSILFLRDDKSGQLILRAGKNLPLILLDRMGDPVQDRIADQVMASREAVVVAEEGLRRFNASRDLYAVAYVPLTVQKTAVGVLSVGNTRTRRLFDERHGRLLKTLADYAAITIVSARLSLTLEQRSSQMQTAYRELQERDVQRSRYLKETLMRLHQPLIAIEADLIRLGQTPGEPVPEATRRKLAILSQQIRQLITQVKALEQQAGR